MKTALYIFLFSFFSLGTLFLPAGDFSSLADLPSMYYHCKSTEDKDMTPVDFITDHLLNIDCLFDKHDNGDEQKPHTPIPNQHQKQTIDTYFASLGITITYFNSIETKLIIPSLNVHRSYYIPEVFRPPIV